jgi:hypothetical protein
VARVALGVTEYKQLVFRILISKNVGLCSKHEATQDSEQAKAGNHRKSALGILSRILRSLISKHFGI